MSTPTPATIAERERFVDDLLAYMTLEEKTGQLAILPQAPDPVQRRAQRNYVGFFDRLRAGRIGAVGGIANHAQAEALQRIAIEETRLGIPLLFMADGEGSFDTVMPAPAAAAASWDMDAIEAAERAVAGELRSRGISWVLGPEIRLIADCAHGDFAQSSGADPLLAARIAAARIRGLQHEAIAGETGTLACLGLVDDLAQSGRDTNGLLEIAVDAVRKGQVGSIHVEPAAPRMVGARLEKSTPALDYLRLPGNFEGILVTDIAELAAQAGQDPLARGLYDLSVERLVAAVRDGKIAESHVNEAVRRMLRAKFDLGLFRTHSRHVPVVTTSEGAARPRPREAALELARKAIVLLRNTDEILPLGVESGDLLIVGSAASDRSLPLGGQDGAAASVIEGLEQLGVPFKYVPGLALRHEGVSAHRLIDADRMAIGMACEAARRARTIIVVLGQGVNGARHSAMGEAQRQLLTALRAVNERIVLVTLGVRPLNPAINGEPLPCVLHAGQLGTMSGHAIAEVLTGEISPTGRLPAALVARDPARSLPFGFGLGYGDIAYSGFSLEMGADRMLASLELRNRGDFAGSETVQLYIRQSDDTTESDTGVLRDFVRVMLQPGERRRVTFEIGAEQLGHLDNDGRILLDDGRYVIELGPNRSRLHSAEIVLPAAVMMAMRSRLAAGGATTGLYGITGRNRA